MPRVLKSVRANLAAQEERARVAAIRRSYYHSREADSPAEPEPSASMMTAEEISDVRSDHEQMAAEMVAEEDPTEDEAQNEPYEIRSRGSGWYDVIDVETGEAVNSNRLRHGEAQAKLAELLTDSAQ